MISDVLRINGQLSGADAISADVYVAEGLTGELSAASAITGVLSGVSGITGALSSTETIETVISVPETLNGDYYDGEYEVTPDFDGRTLETKSKTMREDIVVNPIQVSYTSDLSGGNTVYIGGLING